MDKLLIALDVPSAAEALKLADTLRGAVGGFKIGSQLFTSEGPAIVRTLAARGDRVFLDLKFHDIPNTVAGAVRAAARLGVAMLTLHAAGGRAMLEAAVAAAGDAAARPWLLGVTVLTSLDMADLAATGIASAPGDQALRLGELSLQAGLDGLVCSPQEIATLRHAFGPAPRLVIPGIRPAAGGDDQKRTMVPAEALSLGADVLVIGRPITRAASPAEAAAKIVRSLDGGA